MAKFDKTKKYHVDGCCKGVGPGGRQKHGNHVDLATFLKKPVELR